MEEVLVNELTNNINRQLGNILKVVKFQYNLTEVLHSMEVPIVVKEIDNGEMCIVIHELPNITICNKKNTVMLNIKPLTITLNLPFVGVLNRYINSLFQKSFLIFCVSVSMRVTQYIVQNSFICKRFIEELTEFQKQPVEVAFYEKNDLIEFLRI